MSTGRKGTGLDRSDLDESAGLPKSRLPSAAANTVRGVRPGTVSKGAGTVPTGSPSFSRSLAARIATASVVGATSFVATVGLAAPAHAVTTESSAYFSDLNAERVAHGLRPLTMRADLNDVAQGWSNHMAAADLLSHNPALTTQVANWQTVGENVGEGPDVGSLATAFWNSPAHRANILDSSYTEVGVGSTWSNGVLWITVDFRKPMVSASNAAVARPRSSSGHRSLHLGMRGHDVARVQRRLHVHADGVFGPRTKRAVVRFQRRHHLAATGVVNARTWRALHP